MANFKMVVSGCGGRANSWKQGRFIGDQTFGANGVCGPLAAKWIKDRKHNINFKNDTGSHEGREEVMQLKLNQHKRPGYVCEYLQFFGLHRHFTQTFPDELSMSQLLTVITHHAYYFVGLSTHTADTSKFNGHAFAIDMFGLKFFDPNFGQASFNSADELKRCFTTWFRLKYLDMKGSAYIARYF